MLKPKMVSAIPAYGREYTNPKQVEHDWDCNKDFVLMCIALPRWDGRYFNKSQVGELAQMGVERIQFRFNKQRDAHIIPIPSHAPAR